MLRKDEDIADILHKDEDIAEMKKACFTLNNVKADDLEVFYPIVRHPEKLTKEMVRAFGEFHAQKSIKTPVFEKLDNLANKTTVGKFFNRKSIHNRHVADSFKDCNEEDGYKCWLFLADKYTKLRNVSSSLSLTLFYLFGWAFNDDIRQPFNFSVISLKNKGVTQKQMISLGLENEINRFFIPRFYAEIKDLKQQVAMQNQNVMHSGEHNTSDVTSDAHSQSDGQSEPQQTVQVEPDLNSNQNFQNNFNDNDELYRRYLSYCRK